jgi:hypothetical protein
VLAWQQIWQTGAVCGNPVAFAHESACLTLIRVELTLFGVEQFGWFAALLRPALVKVLVHPATQLGHHNQIFRVQPDGSLRGGAGNSAYDGAPAGEEDSQRFDGGPALPTRLRYSVLDRVPRNRRSRRDRLSRSAETGVRAASAGRIFVNVEPAWPGGAVSAVPAGYKQPICASVNQRPASVPRNSRTRYSDHPCADVPCALRQATCLTS